MARISPRHQRGLPRLPVTRAFAFADSYCTKPRHGAQGGKSDFCDFPNYCGVKGDLLMAVRFMRFWCGRNRKSYQLMQTTSAEGPRLLVFGLCEVTYFCLRRSPKRDAPMRSNRPDVGSGMLLPPSITEPPISLPRVPVIVDMSNAPLVSVTPDI